MVVDDGAGHTIRSVEVESVTEGADGGRWNVEPAIGGRAGNVVCCRLIATGVGNRGEMGIGDDAVGGLSYVVSMWVVSQVVVVAVNVQ